MEWTKKHDRALLDEITVSDLFQYKKGTPERGQVWDSIADNLNAMDYPKLKLLNGHAVIVGHFYVQSIKEGCQKNFKLLE